MMLDTPQSVAKPSSSNTPTGDTPLRETAAEDGWTVVSSRRGSKGKKN